MTVLRPPLRVGLTFDLAQGRPLGPNDPHDRDAELDAPATIEAIEAALVAAGHEVVRLGNLRALLTWLAADVRAVDAVFNVAEGTRGAAREAQVPALLEAFGIAYSGSDPVALALTLDKGLCKRVWLQAGLPTAPFAVLTGQEDLAAQAIDFPAFVKPNAEGSSIGVGDAARVEDQVALEARVRRLWHDYRQPVLLEPYLSGPEFTVAVLEEAGVPRVLGVLQTTDVGGVRSQGAKRATLTGALEVPFAAVSDPQRAAELAELGLRAYRAVGARDFARLDIRCDAAGVANLLEINLLPGLVPGRSPFPLIASSAGLSYPALIARMFDGALRRRVQLEETP